MSKNGRKYTVWLHPGDKRHAVCIDKLDMLLEQIRRGDVKKGTLSAVIAQALFDYFFGRYGYSSGKNKSPASSESIRAPDASRIIALEEPRPTEISATIHEKEVASRENIMRGLLHLTSRL